MTRKMSHSCRRTDWPQSEVVVAAEAVVPAVARQCLQLHNVKVWPVIPLLMLLYTGFYVIIYLWTLL
jgi:hypothetical protein